MLDEEFDIYFGNDESKEDSLKLDNDLMNLWVKKYYKKYWDVDYKKLSEKWLKELLDDCLEIEGYFDWIDNKPYIKDKKLTNKECIVLWSKIENYDGILYFDLFTMLDDCLNKNMSEEYKKSLNDRGVFPDM